MTKRKQFFPFFDGYCNHCSPSARWGSLGFTRVTSSSSRLLSPSPLLSSSSRSQWTLTQTLPQSLGSSHWYPEKIQQCLLRSGACSWGPAVPTKNWSLRLRSSSARWDLELAMEVRIWSPWLRPGSAPKSPSWAKAGRHPMQLARNSLDQPAPHADANHMQETPMPLNNLLNNLQHIQNSTHLAKPQSTFPLGLLAGRHVHTVLGLKFHWKGLHYHTDGI